MKVKVLEYVDLTPGKFQIASATVEIVLELNVFRFAGIKVCQGKSGKKFIDFPKKMKMNPSTNKWETETAYIWCDDDTKKVIEEAVLEGKEGFDPTNEEIGPF